MGMKPAPFVSLTQIPDFSPHQAEVLGTDAHLPPVPDAVLTPSGLQQRFSLKSPQSIAPVHDPRWTQAPLKPASVLMGIVTRAQPTLLLTLRTPHLSSHSGQVALPGGRRDAQDADDMATALREAHEEVGLPASSAQVLGCLPLYITGTGYQVTPVVALLSPDQPWQPNPHEVADVFEVPLAHLMNPANHWRHAVDWQGVRREWYSMPYPSSPPSHLIWGATAGMLRHLYRFLSDETRDA